MMQGGKLTTCNSILLLILYHGLPLRPDKRRKSMLCAASITGRSFLQMLSLGT